MQTKYLHKAQLAQELVIPFMLAGQAYLTFKSLKTDKQFTYKIERQEKTPHKHYCYVLTGPNNMNDYTFFGTIYEGLMPSFYLSDRSELNQASPSVVAFTYVFNKLLQRSNILDLEIWHMGICAKCGRPLTDAESIRVGLGPICRTKK
jgi:hypothetical protein